MLDERTVSIPSDEDRDVFKFDSAHMKQIVTDL